MALQPFEIRKQVMIDSFSELLNTGEAALRKHKRAKCKKEL